MLNKLFKIIEKITPLKYRWILNHDGFKRYFTNTGWMFFGQMFYLLVSFFIGAWIARYLGPENYGILSYSIAFAGLFSFIASLGVDGILIRELVAHPEQRDELLGTAFRLKIIGGFSAFLLITFSVFLFPTTTLVKILTILFASCFILQAINVISCYFQAEVTSKNNVKATLISTLISSILKIAVILLGYGVIWIILVYVLDFVWQWICLVKSYQNCGLKIKTWYFDKELSLKILKNSWPLMLASAAWFIYLRIDQVMIGAFLGNLEVGIYAAAVKLVEVWYFVPGIICSSVFPAIIKAKKMGPVVYKKRLKALYLLMAVIAVFIAIISTILAHWIIIVLYGSAYLGAIGILKIYVWSGVGLFLGIAINQYFLSENYSHYILFYNLLSMIANIVLNLILIPRIGLTGAAWATLISYSMGPVIVIIINFFGSLKIKELINQ